MRQRPWGDPRDSRLRKLLTLLRILIAALDMVSAAMHVVTGDQTLNFQSGVDFFEEEMLKSRTENLKCPYVPKAEKMLYRDKIPGWAIALIVIACLLCVLFSAFAFGMYFREKQGKPMFMTLEASKAAQQARQQAGERKVTRTVYS